MYAQPADPGAKATALGGSFATQYSVFSMRHNVAGLAFIDQNAIAAGARNNYLANNLNDFYVLSLFQLKNGTLGCDLFYYGFEAYQQTALGLSYALQISNSWAVGTRVSYAYNYIPQESVSRYLVSADLGFVGSINNWRFGAAVQNIIQSKWQGRVIESEPIILRIGAGYYFNSNTALTAEFYKSSITNPDFRLGFNYSPVDVLDLRFGFSTLQPAVSFGFGFVFQSLEINMAASWHQQLGLSPVTDLVYEW